MCLGIPAQLVAGNTGHQDLVMAAVGGVPRPVNIGLLDERPGIGDWSALDALGAERAAEDREVAAMQAAMDAAAQAEEEAIAARWMS